MDNNHYESVPKPRYVTEYRKLGDILTLRRDGEKNYLDKLLMQTFISLVIIAAVLLIGNINTAFTNALSDSIKSAISWHVDFTKTIDTFANIKNIIPEAKRNFGLLENKKPNTDNVISVMPEPIAEEVPEFIMPIDGEITSEFGERIHPVFKTLKMHTGIDISAAIGTPIKSATDGTVLKVGEDDVNGKFIRIQKGQYEIIYAHCSKIIAAEGQEIQQGDIIAEVGDTGVVSGAHLHFEIQENDKPVNPLEKLPDIK